MTAKHDDPVDFGAGKTTESPDCSMLEPKFSGIYVIELCSGELRRWRYLGPGEQSHVWWRDVETGLEFSETSVIYAWQIIGVADEDFQPENSVSVVQDNGFPSKE